MRIRLRQSWLYFPIFQHFISFILFLSSSEYDVFHWKGLFIFFPIFFLCITFTSSLDVNDGISPYASIPHTNQIVFSSSFWANSVGTISSLSATIYTVCVFFFSLSVKCLSFSVNQLSHYRKHLLLKDQEMSSICFIHWMLGVVAWLCLPALSQ